MQPTGRNSRAVLRRGLLVARAHVLLTWFWFRLRTRPQRVLRRVTSRAAGATNATVFAGVAMRDIVSAVDRAASLHPFAPQCLERALACRTLLAHFGVEARVVIGVRRDLARVDAHAWIEVAHCTLDGSHRHFTTLAQFS